MSSARDRSFQAILNAIDGTSLPHTVSDPLRTAVTNLFEDRPNAMDKVQAPLGRALRNPTFPAIWKRCVDDIPSSPAYAELRDAAGRIAAFVSEAEDE